MKRFNIVLISLIVVTCTSTLLACDADCVVCHPTLIKNGSFDEDHKILKKCTRCHTAKDNDKTHDTCGADCWQCHDINKVGSLDISEHRALPGCIKCHESIDKNFFGVSSDKHAADTMLLDSLKRGL
jgi:hypothetical protein